MTLTCDHHHVTLDRVNAYDPTKTTVLRKKFERDMVRRWKMLIEAIRVEVVEKDGFGLKTNLGKFDFPRDARKVDEFIKWLRKEEKKGVLEIIEGAGQTSGEKAWHNLYIRSAYQKGLAEAAAKMRKAGAKITSRWVDGGFRRPFHADAAGLLYTRAYGDLEDITSTVEAKIRRLLTRGLIDGKGFMELADEMADTIESIGIHRSRVLVRTETISAHAEASLNTYAEAGLEGVKVKSEFITAQDNRVCPKCQELEGRVYTIEEARGVIPVHPNCRCAWVPSIEDATEVDLR